MAHINHPREITEEAIRGFEALHRAGAIVVNQTPVLRGINDDPRVLGELLDRLSWAGVTPYYFFVNRRNDFAFSTISYTSASGRTNARLPATAGNERYWKKPVKRTDAVISVNALPEFPPRKQTV